jgi:hypothetical protein
LIPVVTATSKVGTQKGVSVYPTLAKSSLYITSDFDLSDATIEVFDIVGNQEILQAPNGKVIDVSDLASGVYTIRIVKEGKEYYQKFIKK